MYFSNLNPRSNSAVMLAIYIWDVNESSQVATIMPAYTLTATVSCVATSSGEAYGNHFYIPYGKDSTLMTMGFVYCAMSTYTDANSGQVSGPPHSLHIYTTKPALFSYRVHVFNFIY